MLRKSDIAKDFASRVRLLALVTGLGLSVFAASGAAACGHLPPGVEPSGPVLRGSPNKADAPTQPIITPHCSFTVPSTGASADASAKPPAQPLDPATTTN